MPSAVNITPRPIYREDLDVGLFSVTQPVMNAGMIALTQINLSNLNAGLPVFTSNAAAQAGGLTVNHLYRSTSDPSVVCVVF